MRDLVCHLVGQPSRVVAWNRTLFHAIETEDTSLSLLQWPNAALGTLLVSTAQAGEPERLEIAGTRGIVGSGGLPLSRSRRTRVDDFVEGLKKLEDGFITKERVFEYCSELRLEDASLEPASRPLPRTTSPWACARRRARGRRSTTSIPCQRRPTEGPRRPSGRRTLRESEGQATKLDA